MLQPRGPETVQIKYKSVQKMWVDHTVCGEENSVQYWTY